MYVERGASSSELAFSDSTSSVSLSAGFDLGVVLAAAKEEPKVLEESTERDRDPPSRFERLEDNFLRSAPAGRRNAVGAFAEVRELPEGRGIRGCA